MAEFTPTQGRYLAFIHAYINLHGHAPAQSEIVEAVGVSAPSVNQMVKTLEKRGLISRKPGQPRSIRLLVPEEDVPAWNRSKAALNTSSERSAKDKRPAAKVIKQSPANLYILSVYLRSGPVSDQFGGKTVLRIIEIRGDQTLEQLHEAIFEAYDRWDEHLYEFQFGKRPFDPAGPNYGIPDQGAGTKQTGNARTTKLDDLGLKKKRVFGYWFDFGDDWFHQIDVERIEQAIATVSYPRIVKRVGKSPPQYADD
jgi:DNA-binding Lrp family transcriptional regulator